MVRSYDAALPSPVACLQDDFVRSVHRPSALSVRAPACVLANGIETFAARQRPALRAAEFLGCRGKAFHV
jgi:hypothetical protein